MLLRSPVLHNVNELPYALVLGQPVGFGSLQDAVNDKTEYKQAAKNIKMCTYSKSTPTKSTEVLIC